MRFLIVIVLVCISYSNIFANQLVWDDVPFIKDWTLIRSWDNLPKLLRGALPAGFEAFRPGLSLAYLIFYQLFGQNVLGWHLQALIVHLVCTVLVYLITIRLISHIGQINKLSLIPFLTALFFGLHPIHTESVTYIASSLNNIGVMFFLSSFYLYLRAREYSSISSVARGRSKSAISSRPPLADSNNIPSILFALLAFFTYEFTLTLPLVMLLYELTIEGGKWKIEKAKRLWPYFVGIGIYLLARFLSGHSLNRGGYLGNSFWLSILVSLKAFLVYIWLLVWPAGLSIIHTISGIISDYGLDPKEAAFHQSFFEPGVILGVGLLGGLGLLGVYFRKRAPLVSFSLGWFLITLLPASNLVPIYQLMSERYLYISSIGFCLFVALLIQKLKVKIQNFLILLLTFALCILTFTRNFIWHDQLSLWSDTFKKNPLSATAAYSLGVSEAQVGQISLAKEHYLTAINLKPNYSKAYTNLCALDIKIGYCLRAVELNPQNPNLLNNLGIAYATLNQLKKAREYFQEALKVDPNFEPAKKNLQKIEN